MKVFFGFFGIKVYPARKFFLGTFGIKVYQARKFYLGTFGIKVIKPESLGRGFLDKTRTLLHTERARQGIERARLGPVTGY